MNKIKRKLVSLRARQQFKMSRDNHFELESIETDNGTLHWAEGELAPGVEVWQLGEGDQQILPEDGNYVAGELTIVVENGVVSEILNNTDMADEKEEEKKGEMQEIDPVAPETGDTVSVEKFNEVVREVEELRVTVEQHEAVIEEVLEFKKQYMSSSNANLEAQKPEAKEISNKTYAASELSKYIK